MEDCTKSRNWCTSEHSSARAPLKGVSISPLESGLSARGGVAARRPQRRRQQRGCRCDVARMDAPPRMLDCTNSSGSCHRGCAAGPEAREACSRAPPKAEEADVPTMAWRTRGALLGKMDMHHAQGPCGQSGGSKVVRSFVRCGPCICVGVREFAFAGTAFILVEQAEFRPSPALRLELVRVRARLPRTLFPASPMVLGRWVTYCVPSCMVAVTGTRHAAAGCLLEVWVRTGVI